MQCGDCRDALNAFVDGELMPEESEEIRRHLPSCDDCAAEHKTLVAVSQRVKAGLVRYPAPDVLKARIRAALAQPSAFEPRSAVEPPRRSRSTSLDAMIAAGLVIALVSGRCVRTPSRGAVSRRRRLANKCSRVTSDRSCQGT